MKLSDDEQILISQNFNNKLINCIKKCPVIFAKSEKLFRNNIKKDAAWRKVAEEMQMSEKKVKNKWKNLRDRFVKENREVTRTSNSGAGQDDVYVSNWPLYSELLFLANHCKSRPLPVVMAFLSKVLQIHIRNNI
ncbi:uncharacterized protein LOC134210392 [Armigeres subalbatus]|uniref:uncharacterized protein LOC134210392 n=1 Tax=Armigeres subalbatus TaxID=124917 RepID=UPI002ED16B17